MLLRINFALLNLCYVQISFVLNGQWHEEKKNAEVFKKCDQKKKYIYLMTQGYLWLIV